jgi:hypothetical protein
MTGDSTATIEPRIDLAQIGPLLMLKGWFRASVPAHTCTAALLKD